MDPILATGLPLYGETQAGVVVEQNTGGVAGAEYCREMTEPAWHLDLCQASPTLWVHEGAGVSKQVVLGLILPVTSLRNTGHTSTQH